ncbi:hypothetical protein C2845_PM13G03530 [Panicum miliaceum]|uniref:PGG domain-containing protein n=1 Tax=Panicum miliaceum TaxID=4540 RepID=A0A3L6RFZ3_PANMI|nr:hypothetical protein C2845_PM13G03530 [Panicum miliaceum]
MASSDEERPPVSRMVATPAKLLMASGRHDCEQLKGLLNREDATTMVAVFTMSANNEAEVSKPAHMFMDPRLLMAARNGNRSELENLLTNQQEQETPAEDHSIIQISEGASRVLDVVEEGNSVVMQAFGCCCNRSRSAAAASVQANCCLPSTCTWAAALQSCVVQLQPKAAAESDASEDHPLANSTDANLAQGQGQSAADAVEEGARHPAAISLLNGVTFDSEEDSALHVVAAAGDAEQYLKCAEMIYGKAKHLVDATNKNGDTPLHRAATAGNLNMVSRLMELAAARENHGGRSVKELLGKKNKIGETVLHCAIRGGSIELVRNLLSKDSELARVPNGDTSPLYLAISLRRLGIAEELFQQGSALSYSGPDGQNILHIAVLRGKALPMLLEWCQRGNLSILHLTRQADIHGRTPLHLAASVDEWPRSLSILFMDFMTAHVGFPLCVLRRMKKEGPTASLIQANKSSLYQPDTGGSYPIHAAAAAGRVKAVVTILERFPSCAALRDGRGRTFLHVAVEKKRWVVVAFACQSPQFESVLNVQDSEGNSALCLAVEAGDQWVFNCLFQNRRVLLDLANKDGLTARDLAHLKIPGKFYYLLNPRSMILRALRFANAAVSDGRPDHMLGKDIRTIDEDKESDKLTNASQVMGIISVLVATVTFAAAFTLPGGYRADDHADPGTPTLAGSYAFDAFVISISLAFICSLLATIGLIYSGFASVDYSIRGRFSDRSKLLPAQLGEKLGCCFRHSYLSGDGPCGSQNCNCCMCHHLYRSAPPKLGHPAGNYSGKYDLAKIRILGSSRLLNVRRSA